MSKINICQILSFFNGNNNFYMKRTIMKNFTNEKYNFLLFIDNGMRNIYTSNYLGNKNCYVFSNNNELNNLLNQFKIDYIILSIDFTKWFNCILTFPRNKIYYIGHGISIHYYDYEFIGNLKGWIDTKINILTLCNIQYNKLSKYMKNVYKIGTLPQIENLVMSKLVKKDKILLIGGRSKIHQRNNGQQVIYDILNISNIIFPKFNIYFKPLQQNINVNITKISNVYISSEHKSLIYDHFDSEIIIIIEGGTAYLEALLSESNVILYLPLLPKKYSSIAAALIYSS